MEQRSTSGGTRPTRTQSEPLYSSVLIHGGADSNSVSDHERNAPYKRRKPQSPQQQQQQQQHDLYATMVYNDEEEENEDEEDDSSLPPLLKRLPKDFGGGTSIEYDNEYYYDDDGDEANKAEDFGTMIVKTNNRTSKLSYNYSYKRRSSSKGPGEEYEDEDEEGGEGFSTFVVNKSERRKGGEGLGGSSMGLAVASMQAVGEFGHGKQRKGSGASPAQGGEEGRSLLRKSSSSIAESFVNREDVSTKYELLNELGKSSILILLLRILTWILVGYDVCGTQLC